MRKKPTNACPKASGRTSDHTNFIIYNYIDSNLGFMSSKLFKILGEKIKIRKRKRNSTRQSN